jgi:hypothetical protein
MSRTHNQPSPSLVETIPPAPVIREQLSVLLKQATLLRALLRVAERKEQKVGSCGGVQVGSAQFAG